MGETNMSQDIESLQYQIHTLHQTISQIGQNLNQLQKKTLRDQKDIWFMMEQLATHIDQQEKQNTKANQKW